VTPVSFYAVLRRDDHDYNNVLYDDKLDIAKETNA